jgi:hypothetical protein
MLHEDGDPPRLRHRELGYSVDAPDSVSWQPISVDGTDVAYFDASLGARLSLSSSCRKTRARPAVLARRLALGTERSQRIASGPVTLGIVEGWSQTFEASEDGHTIRVKTVTLVSAGCVYDWVMVTRDAQAFEQSESAFDVWWHSFEAPPADSDASEVSRHEGNSA